MDLFIVFSSSVRMWFSLQFPILRINFSQQFWSQFNYSQSAILGAGVNLDMSTPDPGVFWDVNWTYLGFPNLNIAVTRWGVLVCVHGFVRTHI